MTSDQESLATRQVFRIEYLDVFRSFGIIAMIMGHIWQGSEFDFFIHAFHMPMFFWISGYLSYNSSKKEISFRNFLIKKAKSLLLPYFVFGTGHFVLYAIIETMEGNDVLFTPLIHLLSINTVGLPICGALWFLTALFFSDVLFFLINRYLPSNSVKAIIIASLSLLGNLTRAIFPFTLPLALGASFVGVGLYYIGYLCKKHEKNIFIHSLGNLSWIPTITLGLIAILLIFTNGEINMREETYAFIPLFWVNALLSVFVGINLSKLIYRHIQDNYIGQWLTSVGRESIIYVCLNQVVIMFVKKSIAGIALPLHFSLLLVLILTLAILWVVSKLMINTKMKVLLGK